MVCKDSFTIDWNIFYTFKPKFTTLKLFIMESQEVIFEKEKIAVMQKISTELFNDLELDVSKVSDDFVNETMTMKLTGFIYSNLADERNLDYYFDRPTFFDWILRRKRKATFNLKVKDLLLNAPKMDNSMRIYIVDNEK